MYVKRSGGHSATCVALSGGHSATCMALSGGHSATCMALSGGHSATCMALSGGHSATRVALSNRLIQCSGSTLSPLPPLPGTIVAMEKEPNILKPEHTSIVEAARDQIEADLTRHRQQ